VVANAQDKACQHATIFSVQRVKTDTAVYILVPIFLLAIAHAGHFVWERKGQEQLNVEKLVFLCLSLIAGVDAAIVVKESNLIGVHAWIVK